MTGSRNLHCKQILEYGSNLVGGVTPGKEEKSILEYQFNTVKDAVKETNATVSVIFVQKFCQDSISKQLMAVLN